VCEDYFCTEVMQSGKQLHSHKLLPQSPASTEGQERGPGRGSLPPKGHALPCGSAGTHNQNNAEIESSPGFKPITRNGLASVTTFQVADVLDPQEIFSACHPEPAYGKQAKRRISTDPEGTWWPSMNFLNRDTAHAPLRCLSAAKGVKIQIGSLLKEFGSPIVAQSILPSRTCSGVRGCRSERQVFYVTSLVTA